MLYPIELRVRLDPRDDTGGEERIRTSGPVLPDQPLSRRLPSATRPPLQHAGGGSRIRTHGAFALRFSRPAPSTTRPSLRTVWHKALRQAFELSSNPLGTTSGTSRPTFAASAWTWTSPSLRKAGS